MATRLAEERAHKLQDFEAEVKSIEESIRDWEYAERLASSADFEALGRAYREEMADRVRGLEQLKEEFLTTPLEPAAAAKLRERIMLTLRDKNNLDDFLGYPARIVVLLKDKRERLDFVKTEIKKLKEGSHG